MHGHNEWLHQVDPDIDTHDGVVGPVRLRVGPGHARQHQHGVDEEDGDHRRPRRADGDQRLVWPLQDDIPVSTRCRFSSYRHTEQHVKCVSFHYYADRILITQHRVLGPELEVEKNKTEEKSGNWEGNRSGGGSSKKKKRVRITGENSGL